jgi:hypothetical protein
VPDLSHRPKKKSLLVKPRSDFFIVYSLNY